MRPQDFSRHRDLAKRMMVCRDRGFALERVEKDSTLTSSILLVAVCHVKTLDPNGIKEIPHYLLVGEFADHRGFPI